MYVKIDISEVIAIRKLAERELDRVLPILRGAVAIRVAEERATHIYNNYTTNLERSTISYDASDPHDNEMTVHAEMGMHYASHVRDRGRTDFDSLMKAADRNIETRLDRIGQTLAKK